MMETTSNLKVPPKVWIFVGPATVLLAIVIGIFAFGRSKPTTMHLLRTKGTVAVSDGEGKEMIPKENLGLYGGYQIGTRSSSFAWIDLDRVKLTKMDQDSEIQIHKEDKHLEIEVKSGSLFFNITEPLADDETMNIRTSTLMVGIRGTCGWVVSQGEKGAQVFILEGQVEAEAADTGETVSVSAGEMAQVSVAEDGKPEITMQPFSEEYVAPFVLSELEEDTDLSAAVLTASGLDVLEPPDPAERLKAEYEAIIASQTILDVGAAEGTSYTADGVTYAGEGLSQAVTLDLNGDGTEELILVTQKGGFWYSGTITKLEVYGVSMGRAVLYDTVNVAEGEYLYDDIPNIFQLRSDGTKPCLWLEHGSQYTGSIRVYALEDQSLILIDGSDDEGRGMNASYDDLADGTYTVLELPPLPASVQQKAELLKELYSHEYEEYPRYTRLMDTDQDGEDEMYLLSTDFFVYDWDGTQMQSTVLESNVRYAKLIDMDQDGKEELLLLLWDSVNTNFYFKVYDWDGSEFQGIQLEYTTADSYNIYREKATGDIYVGGWPQTGSFGEETHFASMTNAEGYFWLRWVHEKWGPIDDPSELSPQERVEYESDIRQSQQEWEEYEAQINRFELIERINPDSYEWQEVLAYTVDEVCQQLMAR